MTCPDQERRSGFPPDVRAQATALACSLPKEQGGALSRWSLAAIVKRRKDVQIAPRMSTSTVWRWFQADKLKPWRFYNWQPILDRQPFLERARPILDVYEQAVQLLRNGVWVVWVDEKTSIQARQLAQEPVPAQPKQPVHVAPRDTRQGAWQVCAGLRVADGDTDGQTSEQKRFGAFPSFLRHVIVPAALRRKVHSLLLILDNGPTHAPKRREHGLQEQGRLHHWPLPIRVLWLPTHASWLHQRAIWFRVVQRTLLTPTHCNRRTELAQSMMEGIRCEHRSPKPIQWSYTVQKLETKLGTVL